MPSKSAPHSRSPRPQSASKRSYSAVVWLCVFSFSACDRSGAGAETPDAPKGRSSAASTGPAAVVADQPGSGAESATRCAQNDQPGPGAESATHCAQSMDELREWGLRVALAGPALSVPAGWQGVPPQGRMAPARDGYTFVFDQHGSALVDGIQARREQIENITRAQIQLWQNLNARESLPEPPVAAFDPRTPWLHVVHWFTFIQSLGYRVVSLAFPVERSFDMPQPTGQKWTIDPWVPFWAARQMRRSPLAVDPPTPSNTSSRRLLIELVIESQRRAGCPISPAELREALWFTLHGEGLQVVHREFVVVPSETPLTKIVGGEDEPWGSVAPRLLATTGPVAVQIK